MKLSASDLHSLTLGAEHLRHLRSLLLRDVDAESLQALKAVVPAAASYR